MCADADPAAVARLDAYRTIVQGLCDDRPDVVCGPDVATLLEPIDFEGCDVHPNALGHQRIALAVAEAVRALRP